jgi:AraC-like DNA-binding protein
MRSPLRYREYPPSPALAPFVACYWTMRAEDACEMPHRVLPDGCADVLFDLGAARATIVGTMRTSIVVPLGGSVDMLGIRFRPGGALPFLRVPLVELTDQRLDVEMVWRAVATELLPELAERPDDATRIAVVERALVARRRGARPVHASVTHALGIIERSGGTIGVSALAASLGVGARRLERRFDEAVGISPKTFARVARFRRVLAQVRDGAPANGPSWARIAHAAGYADQAHFTREFRRLAGITPTGWAAERGAVGFVQDVAESDA